MNRNTWGAKLKRTVTSGLPVSKNRTGKCVQCGACCALPAKCPFLKPKKEGGFYCTIYFLRSFNCRKYPRTREEWITEETCGYNFGEKS